MARATRRFTNGMEIPAMAKRKLKLNDVQKHRLAVACQEVKDVTAQVRGDNPDVAGEAQDSVAHLDTTIDHLEVAAKIGTEEFAEAHADLIEDDKPEPGEDGEEE